MGPTTITATEIGARSAGGIFHQGPIYSCTPLKGTFTDAEVALLEQQAAKAAGGRLVSGAFVSDF